MEKGKMSQKSNRMPFVTETGIFPLFPLNSNRTAKNETMARKVVPVNLRRLQYFDISKIS